MLAAQTEENMISKYKVLAGVSLAFAFTVSALSAQAEDKQIVAIYKSGTQQYFIDQGNGFTKAAEALGYKAKVINVELDSNLAVTAVSDAIASGAKGIAMTAPDQKLGPAVAKAAAAAKIPLVATDDRLMDGEGKPIPFVGFDGTDMGSRVGTTAGDLLKASGWLKSNDYGVLTVGVPTLSVCVDRTKAEEAKIIEAGAAKENIVTVNYDGTTNSSLEASGPVITAHPQVKKWVVFSCNDEGVSGATSALKNAGYTPDDVIAVGLGAYEACRPWAAKQPSMFKAALYISGVDVGDAAAKALIAKIDKGTELPAATIANTTIVTPETYANVMKCN